MTKRRPVWLLRIACWASLSIGGSVQAVTIAISCGGVGQELALCRTGAETWAKQTGHQIRVVSTPNSSTERLALYLQLLAAGAADVDVFQLDVIWPGILENHFIDLKPFAKDAEQYHFAAVIANNTVDGRLVAMPWFVDAGLLYYRKDLLDKYGEQPPDTWKQLTATAQRIQDAERANGADKLWGFVWQGRAYEGLTCVALEWIASYGGGMIVDANGKITVNNPQVVTALQQAATWVGSVTPPGVLNYAEEEARGVFQSGNAVFMRNWPYAWALAQSPDSPISNRVGIKALPKGGPEGRPAATLGGSQLGVSKYSNHPAIAADLVMYLTSAVEQKRRAIQGSFNPSIDSLYKDPDVLAANPFLSELYETVVHAIPRPSSITGSRYNQVSAEFWNAVHSVLSGRLNAADSLARLERRLNRLSRGGKRW